MNALDHLSAVLGDPVTGDHEEAAFLVFSQTLPSAPLGFVDTPSPLVSLSIAGLDLTIRHSRQLLTSNRAAGTTGAVIWNVSPLFAEWIASPNFLFAEGYLDKGSTVLELGAGVAGVVAMVLARRVARYVASDQDYVLKLLRENVVENASLAPPRTRSQSKKKKRKAAETEQVSNIDTLELDWELDSIATLPSQLGLAEGRGVDVVLACDCVYNEALVEPLNSTCAAVCKLRTSSHGKPTLCIVAQQLRSHDVFEAWLGSFTRLFHVWQVPDGLLTESLRENSGFIVHVGMVR